MLPQNITTPLTYEWNLNTQYEFIRNWVLELGYVGSHGIRQEQGGAVANATNWNPGLLITPTSTINGITCDNVTVYCNTTRNVNIRTAFPGISSTTTCSQPTALTYTTPFWRPLRKQFSKGLSLQVSYTYDKGLVTQNYGIDTAPYEVLQLAPSPVYHPQRVVINYVWNLPLHMNGWKGRVLNDWTWAGVTTIQDGVPFSVYDSNAGTVFFQGGAPNADTIGPALLCPGVNPLTSGPIEQRLGGSLSANGYLNPAAFADSGGSCTLPTRGQSLANPAQLRLRQRWRRRFHVTGTIQLGYVYRQTDQDSGKQDSRIARRVLQHLQPPAIFV